MSKYKTSEVLDDILKEDYHIFHDNIEQDLSDYMHSHLESNVKVELVDNYEPEDLIVGEAVIRYKFLLDVKDEMYVEEVRDLMSKYKYKNSIYHMADFGSSNPNDSNEVEFNIQATSIEIIPVDPEPDDELTWIHYEIEVYYDFE